jgi:hypothetical protein
MMSDNPYFTLSVDWSAKIVRITLRGNWSMETLMVFHKARSDLIQSLGQEMNGYSCLSVIRDYGILPADLAEIERASIAEMPFQPTKLAYVVGNALKNFQSKRIANQKLMRSFSTEAEALEWLKSDAG